MSPLRRVYREVDAKASRMDRAESPARAALLTGVVFSGALLAVGLIVMLLHHEARPDQPPGLSEMFHGLLALRGICLIYLGLLVLAFTPVLRVVVMIRVYLQRREWFMLGISVIVLSLLALGLLLGTG